MHNTCCVIAIISEEQLYQPFFYILTAVKLRILKDTSFTLEKFEEHFKNAYTKQNSAVEAEKCLANVYTNAVMNGCTVV